MALFSKESLTYKDKIKKAPVVEIGFSPEIKSESEYVEIVNEEVSLGKEIRDEKTGETIIEDASPKKIEIVLPLTEQEMNKALHLKVIYSFRWLAEWAKRLLKIAGGRIEYHFYQNKTQGQGA